MRRRPVSLVSAVAAVGTVPLALAGAVLAVLGVVQACSPRLHGGPTPVGQPTPLQPLPPPPPGSVVVHGPLVLEAVEPVRAEIGWERELVRATRVVAYDVIVSQVRATCPEDVAPPRSADASGCSAIAADAVLPPTCSAETVRARVEVTVGFSLAVQQRCAGDAAAYVVPEGPDSKPVLAGLEAACFRNRNKFKPEASWTSIYALTELSIVETATTVTTDHAALVGALLDPAAPRRACREDGAFLDGMPADGAKPEGAPKAKSADELARLLAARAPLPGEGTPLGVTGGAFRTEQELWEACRPAAPQSPTDPKNLLLPALRCQLLRQIDRFVREVEDAARPETPKGTATSAPSVSAMPSASTVKP